MLINDDFTQRVVVHGDELEWLDSPIDGVHRRPLDRIGEEVARATTIVRYAPYSSFSPHVHTGGEEFFVLEGVFQDEHGDFPEGSYIRNPPQSRHTPRSTPGTIIFVKLWQMRPEDSTHVRLRTDYMQSVPVTGFDGVTVTPLYQDHLEDVALYRLEAGSRLNLTTPKGAEVLVLDGTVAEGEDSLRKYSWMRAPLNSELNLRAGTQGAKIWVKQGHITQAEDEIARVSAA